MSQWRITWSKAALLRAIRATIVVPGLFALAFKVIGDAQMTLFATFGGFATLIFANFGGSRKDKLAAHLGLAVAGSLALIIGTLVSGITWLAALVTIPVAFAIFFAGVIGPNAAGGVNGALLGYVLPVASAGGASTIGPRLAGWWLASVVGTAAVLLLSPKGPGDRLRASAAACATALSRYLRAMIRGQATDDEHDALKTAERTLLETFSAAPYRPTGLATADQAMANVVQALEWSTTLVADASREGRDLRAAAAADRDLLEVTAGLLDATAALLGGAGGAGEATGAGAAGQPDFGRLETARAASAAHQRQITGDPDTVRAAAGQAFHAQTIAVAVRSAAADALIASGRADPDTVAAERRAWYGQPETGAPRPESRRVALVGSLFLVLRHASLRSVWFENALRGSVALAAAVAVADLTGVQHGFWVVLGTVSVLRSNAAATGANAWRALAGTVVGFALGAALLLVIGTDPTALWIAMPIAVFVATYTPGTAPFLAGQAAFTITVVVLFNLLAPAGWTIGLLRVQDVAIGCAVSLAVGVLFWPRGASTVVGNDLADCFRVGGVYLRQAVDWALGVRTEAPDTALAAVTASIRLDEALRGYLAEQGSKRLDKDDLWRLVMATMRLRLTAHSLAGLHGPPVQNGHLDPIEQRLRDRAAELTDFYDRVAAEVGRPPHARWGWGLGGRGAGAGGAAEAGGAPPALEPVRFESLGDEYPVNADAEAASVRGATVAAEQDVAMAEKMIAADTVKVADARAAGAGGAAGADGIGSVVRVRGHLLWVREHLQHLSERAPIISGPATKVAELRQRPWWR
ncbi:MAG TPA: FUSC family protein [Streptosporangiaceae bacterium]